MCIIYVIENHDQVLKIWRDQKAFDLSVTHIDAHCDMRGLYIDRKFQRAYPLLNKKTRLDPGNYLSHAINEGRIGRLEWVYSEPGGRLYDVGTVKYESDLTALPYRWLHSFRQNKGIPVIYTETKSSNWSGLNDFGCLDIDWDFFASTLFPFTSIPERVAEFLSKGFRVIPNQVFVCYSPDFSHPSRDFFRNFINDLAKTFNANVIDLQPNSNVLTEIPIYRKVLPPTLYQIAQSIYYKASLTLRRLGIY